RGVLVEATANDAAARAAAHLAEVSAAAFASRRVAEEDRVADVEAERRREDRDAAAALRRGVLPDERVEQLEEVAARIDPRRAAIHAGGAELPFAVDDRHSARRASERNRAARTRRRMAVDDAAVGDGDLADVDQRNRAAVIRGQTLADGESFDDPFASR